MNDSEYKLIPMQKTHSVPVRWEFSQDDYNKLAKGHRSNWSVFLRDNTVHICRAGGGEFYRFAISNASDNIYTTGNLEIYIPDNFYETAKQHGWNEEKVKYHQAQLQGNSIEEVIGLLASYLDIHI